jgi:hypothetical protein
MLHVPILHVGYLRTLQDARDEVPEGRAIRVAEVEVGGDLLKERVGIVLLDSLAHRLNAILDLHLIADTAEEKPKPKDQNGEAGRAGDPIKELAVPGVPLRHQQDDGHRGQDQVDGAGVLDHPEEHGAPEKSRSSPRRGRRPYVPG